METPPGDITVLTGSADHAKPHRRLTGLIDR
jgi:hypothetical protein